MDDRTGKSIREILDMANAALEKKLYQFKASVDYWRTEAERVGRSNNALRGQITKLKKRLAETKS